MPWEQRENHKYYYRKVRTGNQVQSIYIGEENSKLANAMHTLEELCRAANGEIDEEHCPVKHRHTNKPHPSRSKA